MAIQTETRPAVAPAKSLWEATGELVSAGQQVVLDRVDLLRSEITDDARALAVASSIVLAAAFVAALGWILVAVALVVLLDRWIPLDASVGIVGGLHLAVGMVFAARAIRTYWNG